MKSNAKWEVWVTPSGDIVPYTSSDAEFRESQGWVKLMVCEAGDEEEPRALEFWETPRTDEAWRQRDGESSYDHQLRKLETCRSLERECSEKSKIIVDFRKKLGELSNWKEQMMEVESKWDEQAVGKLLGIPLGKSIRANIQPRIEELLSKVGSAERRRFSGTLKMPGWLRNLQRGRYDT